MNKEDLIVCRTLQHLDAPVLADFVKGYLRDGFKKFLRDTGQTFDIAKQLVKLTDGKPSDPKHLQPCPIAGCRSKDSFYFQATDHTFHCPKCKFSGDIVELIKRVQNKKSNIAKTADLFLVISKRKAKTAAGGTSQSKPGPKPTKLAEAKEWLIKYFRNRGGTIRYYNLKKQLKQNSDNFSESTVRAAAKALGVKMPQRKEIFPGSDTDWKLSRTVWKKASPSKKGSP